MRTDYTKETVPVGCICKQILGSNTKKGSQALKSANRLDGIFQSSPVVKSQLFIMNGRNFDSWLSDWKQLDLISQGEITLSCKCSTSLKTLVIISQVSAI